MIFIALVVTLLASPAIPALRARMVPDTVSVPSNLIVGRSVCANTTWLLTDWPELIAVSATRKVVVRPVKGVTPMDRLWGLACLSDGSLWTLAAGRVMARLGTDGTVRERVDLRAPRLALFGWLDRLLFADLPTPVGKPLLGTSLPRERSSTPWPKFLGRMAESRAEVIARNLVNCGIGRGRELPCWFADDRRITISDGTTAHSTSFAALYEGKFDAAAPIWDVAVGGADTLWLLISTPAPAGGRKLGGRLVKTNRAGATLASLELHPLARTILHAGETHCALLTVDGHVMEIEGR
jgi:hypothetical protein